MRLCLLCTIFFENIFFLYAQVPTLPTIIPPSPSAASIHQYSSNLNLYTGQPDISIPVYTISEGELNFPISLSYQGSQGIRVQEFASWVGLGWSLSATGAVSRTIRGLADDKEHYMGFWEKPPLPSCENAYVLANEISHGDGDGEPDKFYYTAAGISGSFYITKEMEILQIPMTNRVITPHFEYNGAKARNELQWFTIKDEKGTVYEFKEIEESWSHILGVPLEYFSHDISTWHLTKITDRNSINHIAFEYDTMQYNSYSETYKTKIGQGSFVPNYNKSNHIAKVLKKLSINNTEIRFNKGIERCDLRGNFLLDNIEIYINGALLKKHQFYHSYFDQNGAVALSVPCNYNIQYNGFDDGNHFQRLRLDSLAEFSNDGSSLPPYRFQYNEDEFLPSRHSYSRDHWGFYNGQANNTLEPHYYRYLPNIAAEDEYSFFGEANRNPYLLPTKAGVMQQITYPTGGSSLFEYELHEASNPDLDRELIPQQLSIGTVDPSTEINVQIYDKPFTGVKISSIAVPLSEFCNILVSFDPLGSGPTLVYPLYPANTQALGNYYEKVVSLDSGQYNVTYSIIQDDECPLLNEIIHLTFKWNNESPVTNKKAGGLRVKQIIDYNALGDSLLKQFNYDFLDGMTSGYLPFAPEYGYLEYGRDSPQPNSHIRTSGTNLPLDGTNGSTVGYGRVEVKTSLLVLGPKKLVIQNGKKVHYYLNPKNVPNGRNGFFANRYDEKFTWYGRLYYKWPPAELNDMDWMRGLERAEISYASVNGQYQKVHEKIFNYRLFYPVIFGLNDFSQGEITSELTHYPLDQGLFQITGLKAECAAGGCGYIHAKYYDLFTGRYIPTKTIERNYSGSKVLEKIEKIFYENADYYQPTRTITTNSKNQEEETQYIYPYDATTSPDFTVSEKSVLAQMTTQNQISMMVGTKHLINGNLIDYTLSPYKQYISGIFLESVRRSIQGSRPFITEFQIHAYDQDKVLSVSDKTGVKRKYEYEGYKPVMEAVNSGVDEVKVFSFDRHEYLINPYTGAGCKQLTSSFNLTSSVQPLDGEIYRLTYMWKSGVNDSWEPVEEIITYQTGNSITTSKTTGFIDELRFYPVSAQVKTFYYDSFDRLRQVCDPNSLVHTYDYDSFSRLKYIKDRQKNIMSMYDYSFGLGTVLQNP